MSLALELIALALRGKPVSPGEPPPWPYCYQCDEQADAACGRCGRSFCSQHGGHRLCWRPLFPLSSARWSLARRPLCDVCTPSSAWMGISIGLAVCLALVGGLMAFRFLLAFRR